MCGCVCGLCVFQRSANRRGVGRNVAAGMTGGLGYFYDEEGDFPEKVGSRGECVVLCVFVLIGLCCATPRSKLFVCVAQD